MLHRLQVISFAFVACVSFTDLTSVEGDQVLPVSVVRHRGQDAFPGVTDSALSKSRFIMLRFLH